MLWNDHAKKKRTNFVEGRPDDHKLTLLIIDGLDDSAAKLE